jgi:hypothetical protein
LLVGAALLATVACGVALIAWAMWPGVMSSDSFGQLAEGRYQFYSPAHPPIMAALWHYLDRALPGPGGMLLLQGVLLWSSLAILTWLRLRRTRLGWAVLLIGLCPPVFVLAGHVWKDVQMAAALAISVALLAIARERAQPRVALLALPALFYATAVRHNGITATLPLIVACLLIALPERKPRWAVLAGGVAIAALFMLLDGWLSLALCHGQKLPPTQSNFLHDLVGISQATGEKVLPPSLSRVYPNLTEEQLRTQYMRESSEPILFTAHAMPTPDRAFVSDLRHAWLHAVAHHPSLWLAQRWTMMARQLGISSAEVWYPYHDDVKEKLDAARPDNVSLGVHWHPSRFHTWLFSLMERGLKDSILFRGWIYLLVAIAALVWAARKRRLDTLAIALGASIFLYVMPLFVIAPVPDFRYVYWPVVAGLLTPVIAAGAPAERAAQSSTASSPDT